MFQGDLTSILFENTRQAIFIKYNVTLKHVCATVVVEKL